MLSPKIIHAQIADICYGREERGEQVFELYAGSQLHNIPAGSICIHSDIELKDGAELPDFKRVAHEPLMLATDETFSFIMLHKDGDINQFDLNELCCNWQTNDDEDEVDEYYVLVIKDLNFLFSDSRASAQQKTVAKPSPVQPVSQPIPKKLEFL